MPKDTPKPPSKEKEYHNAYKRRRHFNQFFQSLSCFQLLSKEQQNLIVKCNDCIVEQFYQQEIQPERYLYTKYTMIKIVDYLVHMGSITDSECLTIKHSVGKLDCRTIKANDKIFRSLVEWSKVTSEVLGDIK